MIEYSLVINCKFECFKSHCHILKELHEFLCRMNTLTIFGEGSIVFIIIIIIIISYSMMMPL